MITSRALSARIALLSLSAGVLVSAAPSAVGAGASGLGYDASELNAVVAISARDVWAVGTDSHQRELIEHFNGKRWRAFKAPKPGVRGSLQSVSALGPDDIWAVGSFTGHGTIRPLIERYNGNRWARVDLPITDGSLTSVSADAAGDAWAVGDNATKGGSVPLALHWDGTTWTVVAGPAKSFTAASVSAVSPTLAWVAGTAKGHQAIYRWDGSSLTAMETPRHRRRTSLTAVTATSARNAWAVGYATMKGGEQTVQHMLQWNGHTWKTMGAFFHARESVWSGVWSTADGRAWVVGYGRLDGPQVITFDGHQWAPLPDPEDPFGTLVLNGIAATSPDDVWVVGQGSTRGRASTLIEHYDGTTWTIES